ncbi:MAG: hypothetical protein ACFFHV_06300 [Promethearchaeota archaeon]
MKKSKLNLVISILVLAIILISPYSRNPIKLSKESSSNNLTESLKSADKSGGGYIMDTDADFSWIEINITGTNMTAISDEDDAHDSISFTVWDFEYYGITYNEIFVSTNGWMSFTDEGSTSFWLSEIPSRDIENKDCVALLSEDLNLDNSDFGNGDVFYQFLGSSPNRYLVIEYYQAYDFHNEELVGDFEVIFYENGTIKFQYKLVNNLGGFEPIIGLDHGDLTNYNSYDAILPLYEKAISFEFNQMINAYTPTFNENDQFCWKVNKVNHTAMETDFGPDWEQQFGLIPDMEISEKTKINVTVITENATHWEIKYDMWNWTSTSKNFGALPEVDSILTFRKEPLTYTQKHNLTNFFPLLLPKYPDLYLEKVNLSDSYLDPVYLSSTKETLLIATFLGSLLISCAGTYNENGLLIKLVITAYDGSNFYDALEMNLCSCVVSAPVGGDGGGGGGGGGGGVKEEALPLALIIVVSSIGVAAVIIFVLIKKGIINTSKLRVRRTTE